MFQTRYSAKYREYCIQIMNGYECDGTDIFMLVLYNIGYFTLSVFTHDFDKRPYINELTSWCMLRT